MSYTLERIVSIVKEKVSAFNVRNTFPLTDEMIIDRIYAVRELLIQQNKNKLESQFYSITSCLEVKQYDNNCILNNISVKIDTDMFYVELPHLISGVGDNNIKYFGLGNLKQPFYKVALNNFITNKGNVWSGHVPQYIVLGNTAYIRNMKLGTNKLSLIALLKAPASMCDYNYSETPFPIPQEYKLEYIVVRDILAFLGIPNDEIADARNKIYGNLNIDNDAQEENNEQ